MRARLALSHSKTTIEIREVLLKNRPRELYQISKKGTVPVLELPNQTAIDESIDIMVWAIKHSESDWLKINVNEQMNLISLNDNQLKPWVRKYKYFTNYIQKDQSYYRNKCGEILAIYDEKLKISDFIQGDKMQLVDAAIFPLIRQMHKVDESYIQKNFFNLNKWLERWLASYLFKTIMSKYEPWVTGAKPIFIFN